MLNSGVPGFPGPSPATVDDSAEKEELLQLATAVYAWFVRIYKRLNDDQTSFLHSYEVTPSQYGVMAELMQQDGLTFTELAGRMVLHGSTLTGIVDRLERKGLVVRQGDKRDRRQIKLTLTARGKDLFRGVPTIDENGLLCRTLRTLRPDERADLQRSLGRLGREIGDERYEELIADVLALRQRQ